MSAIFDTLKYADRLKQAGVPPALAEAQSHALAETLEQGLVSKADLKQTELALKSDLKEVGLSLKSDLKALDLSTKAEIMRLDGTLKLHAWMLGFIFTGVAALILKAFF